MEKYFKKSAVVVLLCLLLVTSFLILRPIFLSVILGLLLAFIFSPIYNFFYKKTSSKNFSAAVICILLALLIFSCIWFFLPIAIEQSLKIYMGTQQMDFVGVLRKVSPSFFASEQFSREVGSILQSFVTRSANVLSGQFAGILLNFPTLILQSFVVFLTLFYILRDKEEFGKYLKSLSPFSKELDDKFFEYSKNITSSVIYGIIVVGVIQGLIVGMSLFIFDVPNALFLTLLAILAGIIPVLGPFLVWVPVTIYLLLAQNTLQAIGILIFGVFASTIDNVLRPLIVSKRARMPTSLVFLGMIGGFFLIGFLGFLIGPLVIAYLLIFLELYRKES